MQLHSILCSEGPCAWFDVLLSPFGICDIFEQEAPCSHLYWALQTIQVVVAPGEKSSSFTRMRLGKLRYFEGHLF